MWVSVESRDCRDSRDNRDWMDSMERQGGAGTEQGQSRDCMDSREGRDNREGIPWRFRIIAGCSTGEQAPSCLVLVFVGK